MIVLRKVRIRKLFAFSFFSLSVILLLLELNQLPQNNENREQAKQKFSNPKIVEGNRFGSKSDQGGDGIPGKEFSSKHSVKLSNSRELFSNYQDFLSKNPELAGVNFTRPPKCEKPTMKFMFTKAYKVASRYFTLFTTFLPLV